MSSEFSKTGGQGFGFTWNASFTLNTKKSIKYINNSI